MIIDISTLVITSIFVIAIFGSIAYLIWKGKERTSKSIKVLREVEKLYDLKFLSFDSWTDKAIGIDAVKGKLIYVDLLSEGVLWKLIDLKNSSACQLLNTGDTVQLMITGITGKNKNMDILHFFNIDIDDPVERGFHSTLANKWLKIIESNLKKTTRTPRRAA